MSPPSTLTGRAGAIRFSAKDRDLCIICAYYPPRVESSRDGRLRHYQDTVRLLTSWISDVLDSLPARCTPIIGLDLHGEIGESTDPEDRSVGTWHRGQQCYSSDQFMAMVRRHGLAIVDTHFEVGCTWRGPSGAVPYIDHWAIPQGMLAEVMSCTAVVRAARRLQLVSHRSFLDHVPLFMEFKYRLDVASQAERVKWDTDGIMRCMLGGDRREEVLQKIEERLTAEDSHWSNVVSKGKVNEAWDMVPKAVIEVGLDCFQKKSTTRKPQWVLEFEEEKLVCCT